MNCIDIKNVSYCYRDNNEICLALEDINLSIDSGEFICLIGHSGCGKSTLLSLLAGLMQPDSGMIEVDGVPIKKPSVARAMVFQHYSLFPWMKVSKNVAYSIKQAYRHKGIDLSKSEIEKRVNRYLDEVGMLHAANKYPFQLSGGMQQRVAIAKALAMESDILLLDEPFGALDARSRTELQHLLIDLWHNSKHRRTVVFVTHDLTEALLLATRIVMMKPKHIERVVEVDFPRPRDLDELCVDPRFRALRKELLEGFYEDGTNENQASFGPANDDAEGILHYDDIQGGA